MIRPFTTAEERIIRARYPTEPCEDIARDLGRSMSSVYQRARQLGLSKSRQWIAECTRRRWAEGRNEGSRKSHFRKGQAPANKGRPMSEWMPDPGRSVATRFKAGEMKGAAQPNYRPIGSLRVSKDGYLERKVTDDHPVPTRRWTAVHRLVWEAANGPIPANHIVRFLPGMRTTELEEITLDRLELVSRADNMRRNSHVNWPSDLRRARAQRAWLNRAIHQLEKNGDTND